MKFKFWNSNFSIMTNFLTLPPTDSKYRFYYFQALVTLPWKARNSSAKNYSNLIISGPAETALNLAQLPTNNNDHPSQHRHIQVNINKTLPDNSAISYVLYNSRTSNLNSCFVHGVSAILVCMVRQFGGGNCWCHKGRLRFIYPKKWNFFIVSFIWIVGFLLSYLLVRWSSFTIEKT